MTSLAVGERLRAYVGNVFLLAVHSASATSMRFRVYMIDFSLAPSFAICFDCTLCFAGATPSIIELADFRIGFRQV